MAKCYTPKTQNPVHMGTENILEVNKALKRKEEKQCCLLYYSKHLMP